MAEALSRWASVELQRPENGGGPDVDYTAPALTTIMRNPPGDVCKTDDDGHCGRSYLQWTITQFGRLAAKGFIPLAMLVTGWWLLARRAAMHGAAVRFIGEWVSGVLFGEGGRGRDGGPGRGDPA